MGLALLPHPAAAAQTSRPPLPLLERGSTGKRVEGLQWLLSGKRPSVYLGVATFHHKPNGLFGARTAAAVSEMKTRLGFPSTEPVAGRDLLEILTGKRPRPLGYLMRATRRLAAEKEIDAARASTACAERAIAIAQAEVGVHEIPDGSNDGQRVRVYQAVTGAFHAPWCASFVQWTLKQARIAFPRTAWSSAIADDSAGVFYIVGWSRDHGWLRAIPKPGYLAAFTDRLGHIGLVARVFFTGYLSIEGNSSNSVRQVWHPFGARPTVFIQVPGCAAG